MNNKEIEKYSNYLNNFRISLSKKLKPNVGVVSNVSPVSDGGAIIEIEFVHNKPSKDTIGKHTYQTLNAALKNVKQSGFGGNLDALIFHGTNASMEGNRIVIIKDGNTSEWTPEATEKDFSRIFGSIK
ncbi:TPA: hypothetical protein OZR47_000313 [Escherichia coli]|nr:hypothetical protein [Escherichia coli]HCX4105159.1 hypothetical protein [Escherichia coli]